MATGYQGLIDLISCLISSDVQGLAQLKSPGLGSAQYGSGLEQ